MTSLLQDLRYALRTFAKNPGFTAATVLTLGLGVGGVSTIFAGVHALFIRALPLPEPDRLVALWSKNVSAGFDHANVSYPDYEDWSLESRSFESFAAFLETSPTLTGQGEPDTLPGAQVSGRFFRLLGVRPFAGRTLTPEDDRRDATRVAVLSHGAWQRRFGSDPSAIGKTIMLDGQPFTVVGVMPRAFFLPGYEFMEVWTPFGSDIGSPERGNRGYKAIGRLRRDVTLSQARAELVAIGRRLESAYPKTNTGMEINALLFADDLYDDRFRLGLLTLFGAVGLVLAIGCANIAQLLLGRARTREREVAVRTALGASRARIVRQMLTESLALALLGGVLGIVVAFWGVDAFARWLPEGTARLPEIRLDGGVLIFGLALSALTAIVFGLLPALQASRASFVDTLRHASARGGTGRRQPLQGLLVASEVALSLVLLAGAGLLGKSLSHLRHVDSGFRGQNVATMSVDLSERVYTDDARTLAFYDALLERLGAVADVRAAAAVNTLPMGGTNSWTAISPEGRPPVPRGQEFQTGRMVASPDYFKALGIPMLAGRPFAGTDSASASRVAIVNAEMARRLWPGESAVGKRFKRGAADSDRPWIEIVGVVGNVRHRGLSTDIRPEMFVPLAQSPERSMTLVVSTASDPAGLAPAIRHEVQAVDRNLAVSRVRTMDEVVRDDTAAASLLTGLLAAFAAAAVGLATMGLYAVVSLAVGENTREIGIRMALGAEARDVVRLILRRWMGFALGGMLIGVGAALAAGRALSSLLYTVKPTDVSVFASITALLAGVALLAAYVPARRATRVSPTEALRNE
ncbi:MAG: ABC transporter permease [Thermoanaerobaculia bacterium]